MKLWTCAAVLALSTATAFAQSSQSAPANAPTSPDQTMQSDQNNPTPQHSLAPSSPAGMGGANTANPSDRSSDSMQSTRAHRMDQSASAQSGGRHRTLHPQTASRDDARENQVTAQLNQQQLGGRAQTATSPSDCTANQPGCAPAPGSRGIGPMP